MVNYEQNPIRSYQSLLNCLGVSEQDLEDILRDKERFYNLRPQKKEDGSLREIYNIGHPLKPIIKTARARILAKVKYPEYLHGSLLKRSPRTNAKVHLGAECLVKMDIRHFFPSITESHVHALFRRGFQFSNPVSRVLTEIVTFNGILPQGSPASPAIANLVLWDVEEGLAKFCREKGYGYTRYIDDIAVSASFALNKEQKSEIIKRVNSLITRKGFKVKHGKTKVFGPGDAKTLTGLSIGTNEPKSPSSVLKKCLVRLRICIKRRTSAKLSVL